jgi:hypothetical protein
MDRSDEDRFDRDRSKRGRLEPGVVELGRLGFGPLGPGLIEGRPEVALADSDSAAASLDSVSEEAGTAQEEPDPTHAAPSDDLEPAERRTLVARALSPAGADADDDGQPVDDAPESRILPASSDPEA